MQGKCFETNNNKVSNNQENNLNVTFVYVERLLNVWIQKEVVKVSYIFFF